MQFIPTAIPGVVDIRLSVHGDDRGRFKRHYCEREFRAVGLADHFVQVSHSITFGRGTVRGLHYQLPPSAEDKLVSCTFGKVFDVAVDLRNGSPTFRRWIGAELDESKMLYVPKGCAHGFQILTDEAHLLYLTTEFYTPDIERGVMPDDPAINVEWPLPIANLSARDRSFSPLDDSFEGLTL